MCDNDNGDDSTGARGSQILPFKTLAVAFTHALSGDVIYVSPGTYDQGTTALVNSIQRHGGRIRSRFKHHHRQYFRVDAPRN